MKQLKSSRGPHSRNSKQITKAVAAYHALRVDERPHGTKRRICKQFGITPQSFTSALQRAEMLLSQTS